MTNLTLYQLADEYREAMHALNDMDLDEQTIADTLESISGPLEEKATNVAMIARNLEATAEAIKEAEQKMAARRKALESRSASIKRYLLANMQKCGISKIESPYFSIAIRKNPASVVIDDPNVIPAEFMRQPEPPPPAPDKKAIAEAIKSGKSIPGARLEQSERLDIR